MGIVHQRKIGRGSLESNSREVVRKLEIRDNEREITLDIYFIKSVYPSILNLFITLIYQRMDGNAIRIPRETGSGSGPMEDHDSQPS